METHGGLCGHGTFGRLCLASSLLYSRYLNDPENSPKYRHGIFLKILEKDYLFSHENHKGKLVHNTTKLSESIPRVITTILGRVLYLLVGLGVAFIGFYRVGKVFAILVADWAFFFVFILAIANGI